MDRYLEKHINTSLGYDITMCTGKGCKKAKNCHRAVMYNRYKKDKSSNKYTHVQMVEPSKNCDWYWEE